MNLLALLSGALGLVVAEEELPVEQLDADHSKDEQEEDVDDEDIEDIFEGNHDAVEDGLEGRHPVDHLERTQHTQKLHRLQLCSCRRAPEKVYLSNQTIPPLNIIKTLALNLDELEENNIPLVLTLYDA